MQEVSGEQVEIGIIADRGETKRLVDRLAALGIAFEERGRRFDLPITEEKSVTVTHDFLVDTTMRRAAAKIGFNYAARALGADVMRRTEFDAIRRFVRFCEESEPLVSAQRVSVLVGPEAATTRTHTCGIGWDAPRRQLVCIVSLFNEVTYGIRLCRSDSDEWSSVQSRHLFDPFARCISPIDIAS